MATAQGIRAGKAFVELFADDNQLVRGLRRALPAVQKAHEERARKNGR